MRAGKTTAEGKTERDVSLTCAFYRSYIVFYNVFIIIQTGHFTQIPAFDVEIFKTLSGSRFYPLLARKTMNVITFNLPELLRLVSGSFQVHCGYGHAY